MNGEHHDHEHDQDHEHEHHDHAPDASATAGEEEELRARLEEELKKITVRDVLVQTVVTLINLGGQRLGLSEAGKEASDPEQARVAIEAVRSLLPLLESDQVSAEQVRPVRDALAQLQMAYAQAAGTPAGTPQQAGAPPGSPAGGPQRPEGRKTEPPSPKPSPSGGLWVPPGTKS